MAKKSYGFSAPTAFMPKIKPINVIRADNAIFGSIVIGRSHYIKANEILKAWGYGGANPDKITTGNYMKFVSPTNYVYCPNGSTTNGGYMINEKGALELAKKLKQDASFIKNLYSAAREQCDPKSAHVATTNSLSMSARVISGIIGRLAALKSKKVKPTSIVVVRTHMSVLEYAKHHGKEIDRNERAKIGKELVRRCKVGGHEITSVPSESDKYVEVNGYPIVVLDSYFGLKTA